MRITRTVNDQTYTFELTPEEIFEAHKSFITSWMASEASYIMESEYNSPIDEETANSIAEEGYNNYCVGGATEYDALLEAVDTYCHLSGLDY